MKTKSFILALAATLFSTAVFAQDRTTVTATSNDISDNLDLRAVASIFGDSKDLDDFERRLNNPKDQISNLDLNGDRQVDYLRVIESVEGGAHLIIIQSVLDKDVYQDVATIEVERDANNVVQVQVVGDVYMYGDNYIYEPVYVSRPIIYDYFWVAGYRPYWSSWYWGYYPSYYSFWAPYPVFSYHNHIHHHINVHNTYNYVNVRNNPRHYALASNYRGNGYELRNPGRSFRERNANVRNRYELQQSRSETRGLSTTPRNTGNVRNNTSVSTPRNTSTGTQTGTRSNTGTRSVAQPASVTVDNPRTTTPRANTNTRSESTQVQTRSEETPRASTQTRAETPRVETRSQTSTRSETPRVETRSESPRVNTSSRSETPRVSTPQQSAPRSQGNSGGGGNQNRGGGRR